MRRMKAIEKCPRNVAYCDHVVEHDEIPSVGRLKGCDQHGCVPKFDLDALAERVAALESLVERHKMMHDTDGEEPKPAEPEQHQCICGLFHYRSDGAWKIRNENVLDEPEPMICENAWRCDRLPCRQAVVHTQHEECRKFCTNNDLQTSCVCITLSEFNRRAAEREAKEKRNCARCGVAPAKQNDDLCDGCVAWNEAKRRGMAGEAKERKPAEPIVVGAGDVVAAQEIETGAGESQYGDLITAVKHIRKLDERVAALETGNLKAMHLIDSLEEHVCELNRRKEHSQAEQRRLQEFPKPAEPEPYLNPPIKCICYSCKLNRRKEAKMEPEPGDKIIERDNLNPEGWMRCLAVVGTDIVRGGSGALHCSRDFRVLDRPPLVPGEGVMHREHPEWGVGTMVMTDRAYFPNGGHEADPSKLVRVAWIPELHKKEEPC